MLQKKQHVNIIQKGLHTTYTLYHETKYILLLFLIILTEKKTETNTIVIT
jgi:hypothetical protein